MRESTGTNLAARTELFCWLLASLLLAAGCSQPSDEDRECTPGRTVDCTCSSGATGSQTCRDDGSGFGACSCSSYPDVSVDTGSGSSDGSADAESCKMMGDSCEDVRFPGDLMCPDAANSPGEYEYSVDCIDGVLCFTGHGCRSDDDCCADEVCDKQVTDKHGRGTCLDP